MNNTISLGYWSFSCCVSLPDGRSRDMVGAAAEKRPFAAPPKPRGAADISLNIYAYHLNTCGAIDTILYPYNELAIYFKKNELLFVVVSTGHKNIDHRP